MAGQPTERQIEVLQHLNQSAAAYLIGKTPKTVRDWRLPRNLDGDTYDAHAILTAVVERETANQKVAVEAIERKRAADADISEMKRDIMRGELLPADRASEVFRHALENHIKPALERLGNVSRDTQTAVIEAFQLAIEDIRASVESERNQ